MSDTGVINRNFAMDTLNEVEEFPVGGPPEGFMVGPDYYLHIYEWRYGRLTVQFRNDRVNWKRSQRHIPNLKERMQELATRFGLPLPFFVVGLLDGTSGVLVAP
jgi:hypothetical protein